MRSTGAFNRRKELNDDQGFAENTACPFNMFNGAWLGVMGLFC